VFGARTFMIARSENELGACPFSLFAASGADDVPHAMTMAVIGTRPRKMRSGLVIVPPAV
jgi:hypothetical protein